MDDQELLRRAREKIARLRPRARKMGVVDTHGGIRCVIDEREPRRYDTGRVLAFREPTIDRKEG